MAEIHRLRLGEVLVQAGLIDEHQLSSALADQSRWGRPIGTTLVEMGFLGEAELLPALAHQLGVPMARLNGKKLRPELLELIPRETAQQHRVLPLFVEQEGARQTLHVGLEDPTNVALLDELAFRTSMQIKPVLVARSELSAALVRGYAAPSASSMAPVNAPSPQAAILKKSCPQTDWKHEADATSPAGDSLDHLLQLIDRWVEAGHLNRDQLVHRLIRDDSSGPT